MIGEILAQCQFSVCVKIWKYFYRREKFITQFRTLIELLGIFCCPPVCHIAVFIIVTSLIIKTMCHLVTNDNSNSSVVERIIGIHIEERNLKYSCRETYFVCCRVVVCIHCLRCHEPFIFVYRFARTIVDVPLSPENLAVLYILII